jgi:hypothetical protein
MPEEQQEELYDWMQYLKNPHTFAIQKYLSELIPERYLERRDFIERICGHLMTQKDVEDFGSLVMDIYESGFFRAIRQYKEQFENMGIPTNVITNQLSDKDKNKIFPDQSEKSG